METPSPISAHRGGNPIFPDLQAADPHLLHHEGTFYLYTTFGGQIEAGFTVWSSPDLDQWTHGGMILKLADVSWATGRDWAPAVIEQGGRFFLYFCADDQIGVATSDSPLGPFRDALGHALIDRSGFAPGTDPISNIDPWPFIDENGDAYLYWGAVFASDWLSVRRLGRDMISLEGPLHRTVQATTLHLEAQCVFKRGSLYYLMFSEGGFEAPAGEDAYRVAYATAPTPLGPWTRREPDPVIGTDIEAGIIGPGHHAVLQLPSEDKWLCAYHFHRGDGDRRIAVDPMVFEADGTIQKLKFSAGRQ